MLVEHIMQKEVPTCLPRDSLLEVAARMFDHDVDSLCVLMGDDSGRLLGMLDFRSLCAAAARRGQPLAEIEASAAVMAVTHPVRPYDVLIDVLELMRSASARSLPVVDPVGTLLGVVTLADIARVASESGPGIEALSALDVCRAEFREPLQGPSGK